MVTIYDLLEVDENATKQEIEESYQRLLLEYHKDPRLSAQENQENEMILNKLRIAYDILSNDEKRKKYDNDLAKKRAEDLIKNVSSSNTAKEENTNKDKKIESDEKTNNTSTSTNVSSNNFEASSKNISETNFETRNDVEKSKVAEEDFSEDYQEDEVSLSKEEQAKLRKAAQMEFKNNLKKAQKAEEEYNQAYNEAYNNYLRKMGYNVKEPWTLKRVKNVVITLVAIILVCVIAWMIPPVREILTGIYEDNIIIKSVVDIFGMFINAILSIFKK